jgi:hypothetical protein
MYIIKNEEDLGGGHSESNNPEGEKRKIDPYNHKLNYIWMTHRQSLERV